MQPNSKQDVEDVKIPSVVTLFLVVVFVVVTTIFLRVVVVVRLVVVVTETLKHVDPALCNNIQTLRRPLLLSYRNAT